MNQIQHSATRGGVANFGMFSAPNPFCTINGIDPNHLQPVKLQFLTDPTNTSLLTYSNVSPKVKPISDNQRKTLYRPSKQAVTSIVFSESPKTIYLLNSKSLAFISHQINGTVFAENETLNT